MRMQMGVILIALTLVASQGCAASQSHDEEASIWLNDFEAAKKLAGERNVPILADFSGSDWCGWCIKLDKEVFSKKIFQDYAKKELVLFLADFPSRKKLAPEVTAQNEKLAKTYGIRGFPTVLVLDAKGKELARTGYRAGGPTPYVAHIRELVSKAESTKSAP